MLEIFKAIVKTYITDPPKKEVLLDWLEEHDTPEYHKNPLPVGYRTNRLWYREMASVESLEKQKQNMLSYYRKNHPEKLSELEEKQEYMARRLEKLQEDF